MRTAICPIRGVWGLNIVRIGIYESTWNLRRFYYLLYAPMISISFLKILQVQSQQLGVGVSISYAFVILYIWLNVIVFLAFVAS